MAPATQIPDLAFIPIEHFAGPTAPALINECLSFLQILQRRLSHLTRHLAQYENTLRTLNTPSPFSSPVAAQTTTATNPNAQKVLQHLIDLTSEHITDIIIDELAFRDIVNEGCESVDVCLRDCLEDALAAFRESKRVFNGQLGGLLKELSREVFERTELDMAGRGGGRSEVI